MIQTLEYLRYSPTGQIIPKYIIEVNLDSIYGNCRSFVYFIGRLWEILGEYVGNLPKEVCFNMVGMGLLPKAVYSKELEEYIKKGLIYSIKNRINQQYTI
jgi:hypothetical protein